MSKQISVAPTGELIEEETPKNTVQESSTLLSPDNDQVNNPSHYQSYIKDGIDCITAMQHAFGIEATALFCKLNAFKYVWRASSKGGNESIEKAQWYLKKYLELGGENL
jgi:hypothetical protein